MPNILVTGANGQVGKELQTLSSDYDGTFLFTDRDSLDITDKKAIEAYVHNNAIDVIINAAAYTAVDKAEEDQETAEKVNHVAVRHLAEIAKAHAVQFIHISTDYVFDGKNYRPYIEDDETNPNSVYGATKLAGEQAIQEVNPKNAIIIRTSWVYSSYGSNFVKTMLRLGQERDSLGVIFDQVGTPTYAKDLAGAILKIVSEYKSPDTEDNDTISNVEIYHYSNEGVCSWYDFAKEIMHMAKIECVIAPIETKEYPTPATRPHYSLLNKSKIKTKYNLTIPYWKDSLDLCLKTLGAISHVQQ